MDVKILGPGCPKCEQLAQNTQDAIKELGVAASFEKVTDIKTISSYGVMMTPALVVDGQVKSVGKVLKPGDIKKFLQA